jgi:hypothetical protein
LEIVGIKLNAWTIQDFEIEVASAADDMKTFYLAGGIAVADAKREGGC